ncbi:MAG TPA: MFS transporter [Candidatus Margulisiibacteriota bacterium]|nr:MFS transporter [Candidatus Margulisiibacteriota bacterium]
MVITQPIAGQENRRDRRIALAILTVINFLNYIDRYVVASVFEPIKRELHFSDVELGWVLSAFMIAYAVTSPVFGRLGDLFTRKYLIAAGVGLWSCATAGAGLARSFWQMFVPRAFVGIGEATYATLAPAVIADYYEPKRRGRALAIFYAAIPAGSALGFVLGGQLAHHFGWRVAFFAVGLPGLLFALMTLTIREPARGASEGTTVRPGAAPTLLATYRMLWANVTYVFVTMGFIAYTFAMGGLVGWMPAFLERYDGMTTVRANDVFGTLTVAAGIVGTLAGGFLGDYLLRYTKNAYLWLSGLSLLAGAPITVLALASREPTIFLPAIFVAEFCLFLNTGPLNAVVVGCVAAEIRATAMAVNILFIHALGDALSPPIIGALSDHFGLFRATMVAPAMMLVSGGVLLYAIRFQTTTATTART